MRSYVFTRVVLAVVCWGATSSLSNADVTTYSANDAGSGPTASRPNSDAAAAAFLAGARALGQVTTIDLESLPLVSVADSMVLDENTTIHEEDVVHANATIENSGSALLGFNKQFMYG